VIEVVWTEGERTLPNNLIRAGINKGEELFVCGLDRIEFPEILEHAEVVVTKVEIQTPWGAARLANAKCFNLAKMDLVAKLQSEINLKPTGRCCNFCFTFKFYQDFVFLELRKKYCNSPFNQPSRRQSVFANTLK
jgi:hypothetical protein